MDANFALGLLLVSLVVNVLLVVAYRNRTGPKALKETQALSRLIKQFERDRSITLHIQAIDEENIFIRNPARR